MHAIRAARTLRIPGSASSGTAVASPSAPSSSCADVKFPVDANLDLKPSLWPAALLNTSVVGRCSASVGGFAAWNWYWFMSRCERASPPPRGGLGQGRKGRNPTGGHGGRPSQNESNPCLRLSALVRKACAVSCAHVSEGRRGGSGRGGAGRGLHLPRFLRGGSQPPHGAQARRARRRRLSRLVRVIARRRVASRARDLLDEDLQGGLACCIYRTWGLGLGAWG